MKDYITREFIQVMNEDGAEFIFEIIEYDDHHSIHIYWDKPLILDKSRENRTVLKEPFQKAIRKITPYQKGCNGSMNN